jgi:hypothetical protein
MSFLLSGLKAHGTIAPEVAFMLGERSRCGVEYPVGGSAAIPTIHTYCRDVPAERLYDGCDIFISVNKSDMI